MPERVLVTGANGFVGRWLCETLIRAGYAVRAALRSEGADGLTRVEPVVVGEIHGGTDWSRALEGVACVVHLAARVHVMRDRAANPLGAFRGPNVEGTERLARAAVAAGARRLVYLSSIKVLGEESPHPYSARSEPAPEGPYAISKWEAEQALVRVARETGLEVVVFRPPLVYGPGVKANFLSLLRAVDRGLPLPLGRVENRRSLLFVGNLADAIRRALAHPAAPGRSFVISDGEDLSTADLVRKLAGSLGRSPRLVPAPPGLIRFAGRVLGRAPTVRRLLGSLVVDASELREALGWRAPYTVDEGLGETARWYRSVRPR